MNLVKENCVFNKLHIEIRWITQVGTIMCVMLILTMCSDGNSISPSSLLFIEETGGETTRIYSTYPDGSNFNLITEFDKLFLYWLSPDGRFLVLINRFKLDSSDLAPGTLQVVDIANNKVIKVIENINHFAVEMFDYSENVVWSPQSDKFIYLKESDGGNGINLWLYDFELDSIRQLTNGESIDRAPAWSHDGEQIAFTTLQSCNESLLNCDPLSGTVDELYWEIAKVEAEGTNYQIITNFKDSGLLEPDMVLTMFCNLLWSPDNKHVVFENLCELYNSLPTEKEIFITATDGSSLWQVTNFSENSLLPSYDKPLSFFSFQWTDSNDLLIGFSTIPQQLAYSKAGNYQGGFLTVNNSSTIANVTEILNAGTGFAGWSSTARYVLWFNEQREDSMWKPQGTSLGELQGDEIVDIPISKEFPVGSKCYNCTTVWSPDEKYAAYVIAEKNDEIITECLHGTENMCGIAIVSPMEGLTALIESHSGETIRPIGWVSNEKLK